jgi:hypothetical protein
MPDEKGNLYIHEAVALRKEYDSHISMLQGLVTESGGKKGSFLSRDDSEMKRPVDDFNQADFEDTLKKLQTKRLKLNQEIQAANFNTKIEFEGDSISIAEALEIRKSVIAEIKAAASKTNESAFSTVIHKEERDIIEKPRYPFKKSYIEFLEAVRRLRKIEGLIHTANHKNTVTFKDEK